MDSNVWKYNILLSITYKRSFLLLFMSLLPGNRCLRSFLRSALSAFDFATVFLQVYKTLPFSLTCKAWLPWAMLLLSLKVLELSLAQDPMIPYFEAPPKINIFASLSTSPMIIPCHNKGMSLLSIRPLHNVQQMNYFFPIWSYLKYFLIENTYFETIKCLHYLKKKEKKNK